MKKIVALLVSIVLLHPLSSSAETLTFSVVPQQSASKLARLWSPILAYLSEQSGVKLQFTTAKDIPTFEKRLADGEYDFAPTEMSWPLSHMVAPAGDALQCADCHGEGGRMDWDALGYPGDPAAHGARRVETAAVEGDTR